MNEIEEIKTRIHEIRGRQVMIDKDLDELYGVEVRTLNQAVKRNAKRFPPDFMFQLYKDEWEILKSQFVISSWGRCKNSSLCFHRKRSNHAVQRAS